ncbi:unnamed protein product [Sphagnum balticum]
MLPHKRKDHRRPKEPGHATTRAEGPQTLQEPGHATVQAEGPTGLTCSNKSSESSDESGVVIFCVYLGNLGINRRRTSSIIYGAISKVVGQRRVCQVKRLCHIYFSCQNVSCTSH